MVTESSQLLRMSKAQLDELYVKSSAGPIPDGEGVGTAIAFPGTWLAHLVAWIGRWFLWQGKVFDAGRGMLVNRISIFSIKAIKAKVYKDPSWLDQKEAVILDYSRTSLLARKVRDEIREISPGLYLGKVYWGRKRLLDFSVDFREHARRKRWGPWARTLLVIVAVLLIYFVIRFNRDAPVTYSKIEDHFKYGSTGGERLSGIPYALWNVLPKLFQDYLPGEYVPGREYAVFGFIYEPGRDLPIGVSKRNVQGLDRVFLNCAVCHVGTVRDSPHSLPRTLLGMPANTVDLGRFEQFLFQCAADPRFNPQSLLSEIPVFGGDLDIINRQILRYYGIHVMKDRLLALRNMFRFTEREPAFGPGRFDTFNPPKALLNFPMDKVPEREWVGIADFPSIWLQGPRKGMQLHWDGNNDKVEERNRSAAFGTGAFPPSLDRPSLRRIEDWLLTREPPPYPYPIDAALAAKGQPVYEQYCLACHGKDGRDFSGPLVGKVTPVERVGTDRHRLDSYSYELCAAQNTLYAGYETERFTHFRKTFGYANMPLDGIWLRAPYLHNGSVPTLRDLLEPSAKRPKVFFRGYDVYDPHGVGFVSAEEAWVAEGKGRYFRFDTTLPGNGNSGHEGPDYGTELPTAEKDALMEYLKTF